MIDLERPHVGTRAACAALAAQRHGDGEAERRGSLRWLRECGVRCGAHRTLARLIRSSLRPAAERASGLRAPRRGDGRRRVCGLKPWCAGTRERRGDGDDPAAAAPACRPRRGAGQRHGRLHARPARPAPPSSGPSTARRHGSADGDRHEGRQQPLQRHRVGADQRDRLGGGTGRGSCTASSWPLQNRPSMSRWNQPPAVLTLGRTRPPVLKSENPSPPDT